MQMLAYKMNWFVDELASFNVGLIIFQFCLCSINFVNKLYIQDIVGYIACEKTKCIIWTCMEQLFGKKFWLLQFWTLKCTLKYHVSHT